MSSRLVICGGDGSRDVVQEVLAGQPRVGWARLGPGTWLLADPARRDSSWWFGRLHELLPEVDLTVLEVSGIGWSGYLPSEQLEWLKSNWSEG